ncbi:MAG: serine/threonine-protein kinase, partial [Pseudomonadota bacterium]
MNERMQKVQTLFSQALEVEPEKRREFLYQSADGDNTLVEEVEALLRHDDESNDSLFVSVSKQANDLLASKPRRETIGKYRVLRELGQGGMGTVYLATRDDDEYQKEVAIKLVPAVVDRDELMRRFRAERQIMASLEHPNIARLLDGDTTRDGVPYVVMEYVRGLSIDQYVSENKLETDARIALFRQVCDAVSHAHRNLVIHRDIKPGNILVTDDGAPKLLDFGIAKILDTDGGPALTRSGTRLMTPEYASPEQARGEPVNTASDVYSLGVLLSKLLTGEMPYDLDTRELGGIEKIICEQPPARPSAQNPSLDTELDDIVSMALRKEPERRYPSVAALSDDLARYLDHRPIEARADTLGYRASKFIRRNRIGVAAGASVVAALIAGIGLASIGMMRAQQAEADALKEAKVAREVTGAFSRMFTAADRYGQNRESITVEDLLDKGL